LNRTYGRLLLLQALLAAANSMAAVFAIIYLLDVANFSRTDAVLFNLLSFAVAALGCVALTRFPPRRMRTWMAAGLVALAASYGAYLVLSGWPLLLFVAVAWGAYIPAFFLPFNALVIGITRPEDRAGKIASFILAYTVIGIAGPTVGGAIIGASGYPLLFALAVAVLLAAVAFLTQIRESVAPVTFAFDFGGIGRRTSVALFAEGAFEGMSFGVIPLIAYAFTTESEDLGALFSLFALAGGVVTVVLGVWSDRVRNRRPFLFLGAAASAAAATLVVRAGTLPEFALGNSLLALTASIAPLFLFAIAVERLPGRESAAIVTREVLLNSGRTASLAAYFVLVSLGLSVQQAFVLASVSIAFVAVGRPPKAEGQSRPSVPSPPPAASGARMPVPVKRPARRR